MSQMKNQESFPRDVGVILVDHGSRFAPANELLHDMAALFEQVSGAAIVEPAHMELATPTIDDAFARCVSRGARLIVVHPYFLSPGRHGTDDIPRMTAAAAARFPGVDYRVTAPLGYDRRIAEVSLRRVRESLTAVAAIEARSDA